MSASAPIEDRRPTPRQRAGRSALPICAALWLCAGLLASPSRAAAEEGEPPARPTIQDRFARKTSSLNVHLVGMHHVRNDFYNSWGGGADIGYYFSEQLGAELRLVFLRSTLSETAIDLKERIGLTPDARPQQLWATAGARFSLGYGKILVFDSFVVHFDPQIVAHGGIARAETRILPTLTTALSLLMHFQWGLQAKIDLAMTYQWETRERGTVFTLGFAPFFGLGFSFDLFGQNS
jgi:hypothetical protein